MPSLSISISALVALLAASLLPAGARAAEYDPWLGPDKALHFSLSAGLAGGGYAVSSAFVDEPVHRLLIGGSFALGLGVAKELYDATGAGTPSWKDLAWDVVGTVTGLAVAWTIDQLFFAPRPARTAVKPKVIWRAGGPFVFSAPRGASRF